MNQPRTTQKGTEMTTVQNATYHEGYRQAMSELKPEIDRLRALVECKDCMEYAQQLLAADRAENDRLREENAELREALREFDEFAWTAVKADCKEARRNLQGKIDKARAILTRTAKD
jgi:hypothetical protein